MTTIAVSSFRNRLSDFLELIKKGQTVVLTSRGQEVAWLVPPRKKSQAALAEIKKLRKKAWIGDIISPVSSDWKALK